MRFKRWSSPTGLDTLRRILWGELEMGEAIARLSLPGWEVELIGRARWGWPKRRRPPRRRARAREVARLARELDLLRSGHVEPELLTKLEHPAFRGKREHFVRLLAFHRRHEKWNGWRRRTGAVPDLRGANLAGLDLGGVNLRRALLRDAELSGALFRECQMRGADLRGCRMRHTDLSYAHLQRADLRNAKLTETLMTGAEMNNADLRRAWLVGTFLNQVDLRGADLRGAVVWGVSTWDVKDKGAKQAGLRMAPGIDPIDYDEKAVLRPDGSVRVDDLAVAQFMSLVVDNPKLGRIVNTAADRIVLLLGRFVGEDEDEKILEGLTEALPSFGYVPVVFDFEEPQDRDTIETVAILAGLANFVIADLSRPRSTPLEAHLIIPAIAVPFVPIIRAGERPFAMFTALQRKYPWVLPTVKYRSRAGLLRRLKKAVIEPAERAALEIRRWKHPRKRRRRRPK